MVVWDIRVSEFDSGDVIYAISIGDEERSVQSFPSFTNSSVYFSVMTVDCPEEFESSSYGRPLRSRVVLRIKKYKVARDTWQNPLSVSLAKIFDVAA